MQSKIDHSSDRGATPPWWAGLVLAGLLLAVFGGVSDSARAEELPLTGLPSAQGIISIARDYSCGLRSDDGKCNTPSFEIHHLWLPLIGREHLTARPESAVGWAVGNSLSDGYGVIIHTSDGGQTWARQGKAGEVPDVNLSNVAAIDHQNAWIVGEQANGYGLILRTHNGGRTWKRQGFSGELAGANLWGVYALDNKTAWVTGLPSILLHTMDGGKTWTRQAQDLLPPQIEVSGIYASDSLHAWATTVQPALVLRTTDGGARWRTVPYACEHCGWLIWPHGVDADTVWVSGNGVVMKTANGGSTWVDQTPPSMGDFNGLVAVDRQTIWTVLDPAVIFRSNDGGATWEQQYHMAGERFIRISAVDRKTAWTVGEGQRDANTGHVLFTEDGGETWTIQKTPVETGWYGVSFIK